MENNQEIIVFKANGREVQLGVDYDADNLWATQAQIGEIFDIDVSRVSRHISNIFSDGEVDEKSNLRKTQRTGR